MSHAFLRMLLLGLALIAAASVRADDPKVDYGEALPKGAKLRLGDGGVISRNIGFTLLPPDFTVIADMDASGSGVQRFDLATGRALDRADAAPRIGGGG